MPADPAPLTCEEQRAWDLGHEVGYIAGRASRQTELDALEELADRYYRAAFNDERRTQVGRLTRAELEERRRAAPLPPQITPEQALASWGLDVEPLPESERPPEPPQTAPSRTTYTNRRSIMSTRVIVGNLAADPEAIAAGQVTITKFRVMENTGEYRKGDWVKHETPTAHFVEAKFELGEHILASLRKGDRVIVVGREHTRSWEKPGGGTGYGRIIIAENVGPDLTYTTAQPNRQPAQSAPANEWMTAGANG